MAKAKTHSAMFEQIKTWYDTGRWTKARVADAVKKGKITGLEYTEITGEPYEE